MGLGDSWHKMMVYFGVSDDEEDYEEEETLAPQEDLEHVYQERGSNVRKLSRGRGYAFIISFSAVGNRKVLRTW